MSGAVDEGDVDGATADDALARFILARCVARAKSLTRKGFKQTRSLPVEIQARLEGHRASGAEFRPDKSLTVVRRQETAFGLHSERPLLAGTVGGGSARRLPFSAHTTLRLPVAQQPDEPRAHPAGP